MSKTIDLKIAERIQLIGVFNQLKGDVETLGAVLEDIKQVAIEDDEKKAINFTEIKNPLTGELESYKWDPDAPSKEITLSDKSVAFVIKFIDGKSTEEALGIADAPILEVINKLKA